MDCAQAKKFIIASKNELKEHGATALSILAASNDHRAQSAVKIFEHTLQCPSCFKILGEAHQERITQKLGPGQKLIEGKIWEETKIWHLNYQAEDKEGRDGRGRSWDGNICVHLTKEEVQRCLQACHLGQQISFLFEDYPNGSWNNTLNGLMDLIPCFGGGEVQQYNIQSRKILSRKEGKKTQYYAGKKIRTRRSLLLHLNGGDYIDGDKFDLDDCNNFVNCAYNKLSYEGHRTNNILNYLDRELQKLIGEIPDRTLSKKLVSFQQGLKKPLMRIWVEKPEKDA